MDTNTTETTYQTIKKHAVINTLSQMRTKGNKLLRTIRSRNRIITVQSQPVIAPNAATPEIAVVTAPTPAVCKVVPAFTELSTVAAVMPSVCPTVALGIISYARSVMTLPATIASIRTAGFNESVHIFSQNTYDDTDVLPEQIDGIEIHHNSGFGIYNNWFMASQWLLNTIDADWYMIMQDDIEWSAGSAEIMYYTMDQLDRSTTGLTRNRIGVLSAYTSPAMVDNTRHAMGWTEARFWGATKGLWGALALCLPKETLCKVLSNTYFLSHKGPHALDYALGTTLRSHIEPPLGVKVHLPSLVEHRGEISTIFSSATLTAAGLNYMRHGYKYKADLNAWRQTCPTQV